MKKLTLVLLAALAWHLPAVSVAGESTQQSAIEQSEKVQEIWIDVRTPEEFVKGHIDGAVNLPFDQIGARIQEVTTDKNAAINLYCRSGRRSELALETLKALGYTNLTNQGGYQDLLVKNRR
ncbi:rhodanese-like domain-containing protein [Exercitatus varius]|uniref:rhodanese-like domain-containing protein n=1 Tax=Exercitatus varius TaxID=67857 RepID=UPI00294B45FD|nr:rhodanese-like domain-containing protein [Exercitatus varius]MDG2957783.1 rhodanese-like domain-containing protein [Exercitatus varius]